MPFLPIQLCRLSSSVSATLLQVSRVFMRFSGPVAAKHTLSRLLWT